jgi:hypothetical protein
MYNHRQRRDMEKKLGLLDEFQRMTEAEKNAVRKRKIEAGKQIHLKNVQELENQKIQSAADTYARQIQGFMDSGKTYEEAEAILKKNSEVSQKRAEDLARRREKQLQKIAEKKTKSSK